jgi:hypothetical protein
MEGGAAAASSGCDGGRGSSSLLGLHLAVPLLLPPLCLSCVSHTMDKLRNTRTHILTKEEEDFGMVLSLDTHISYIFCSALTACFFSLTESSIYTRVLDLSTSH